ncbi:MAG: hypothetical protein KatS3mg129_2750 [Leptospiraceae bacterium]|nr:MAG: hypothetical protein KatS3mg129_2750 [Leptospiraceae bacterium]
MKNKIIILLTFLLLGMQNCTIPVQKEEKQILSYKLEYYKTNQKPQGILVQLDPISFPINVLEKNWIPFLLKKNYHIVQIHQKEKKILSTQELQAIIDNLKIHFNTDNLILTGISFGGISILDWMNETENLSSISRIILIGTGWDYHYSGNLFYENKDILNHKIEEINNPKFQSYKTYLLKNYDSSLINKFFIPAINTEQKTIQYINKHNIPVLIVIGKIDNFSPEDSIITFIKHYSNCKFSTKLNRCYYIEASRANFFDIDYNHFDLFLYNDVKDDLYEDIEEWLDENFM